MRTRRVLGCLAAGAALVPFAAAAQADAAPKTTPLTPLTVVKTITDTPIGPLQFAVDGSKVYVADDFLGTLTIVGQNSPLVTAPAGMELAAVGVDPKTHGYAYTTNDQEHTQSYLTIVQPGKAPIVADLHAYEVNHNPDQFNHYGFMNASAQCISEVEAFNASNPENAIPVSYTGELDTHPYAVTALPNGAWAVADAGGNDILKVDKAGNVSLIALLPPQSVTITSTFAQANGVPPSCVGATYSFEAVPTDVERGPDALYATTLPGGPEGPDSGNPGSIYRIDGDHNVKRVATGFNSATNLAFDDRGNAFVAELGSGTITEVPRRGPSGVVATLPAVVAVEYANGHLYASTAPAVLSQGGGSDGPPPAGSVVELGPAS